MNPPLEAESTLTDRYQTTIPETVRRALKLTKRDKLHYSIGSNGQVIVTRATPTENQDPALGPFLDLLAHDMAEHPERLQAVDADFAARIQALVGNIEIDLDSPLPADDE